MSDGHEHSDGHGHDGAHDHHHDLRFLTGEAQPEVFAASAELDFGAPVSQAAVEAAVAAFLKRLGGGLAAAGCVLVGHIKGVVTAEDGDELEFSLTRLDAGPRFGGRLGAAARRADLTLNVIVFGVDAEALPGLVTGAWADGDTSAAWRTPGR